MNAKTNPPESREPLLSPQLTGFALILLVVLIVLAAAYLPPGWNWIATLVLMFAFVMFLGKVMTYRIWGFLINDRNLMSVSRFQTTLWTLLVLSGFFAIVMQRLAAGHVSDALDVAIPWEVWSLLGISSAALVGSPLISNGKRAKTPKDPNDMGKQLDKRFGFQDGTSARVREGTLYANPKIEDARFTDMFEGDELKDTSLIDLAKLQMFFFTVVVAVAYGAGLFNLLTSTDLGAKVAMPTMSAGLLALMGISNGAYLANKGIEKTPTT